MKTRRYKWITLLSAAVVLASCSTTKLVPDDDRLFIGLTKIEYTNYEKNDHFLSTQEEIEAALATAPNGALFGSSYYRTPFPYGLWIWNAYSSSTSGFGKWMTKSFGKQPVLMSNVNPALRAGVAKELLRQHGYFRANVDYSVVEQKNPKKAKIGYTANLGHLFTIDSLQYLNFPPDADSLIHANEGAALLHNGDPFDLSTLESERTRISNLLRNNGYYYYQSTYASYLADTLQTPGVALLHLQFADSVPDRVTRKWYMRNVKLRIKKDIMEQPTDSVTFRDLTVCFTGKRPKIRPRVLLGNMEIRPRKLYSYDDYTTSANNLASTGMFSSIDFTFTPTDTTATCNTLDLTLNCVLDKPYDFYIETNVVGKTTGKVGPEVVLGMTKRNTFRGGETLDINLFGSYEWQTGHNSDGTSSDMNSYEYGASASLEFPRLLTPFKIRRRWYKQPSTELKVSFEVINRSDYFKRNVASAEITYKFQRTATSTHQFSPLILQYEYMQNKTSKFEAILDESPYLTVTMADQFVPKMKYVYTYSSPTSYRNPIYWQLAVSEASNILSLAYVATGSKWGEKNKELLSNPYAQFLKLETTFRKTWAVGDHSELIGHINAGIIWSYGNSTSAPYSEQFYVGGANSIRAFNVRSIGPGAYHTTGSTYSSSYMDQTGDIKFQANLEFRPRLFGSLYGAVFLDAGNVWALRDDGYRTGAKFEAKNFLKETALGTGVGIRYDLEFLVLRLDWGVGIHVPYKSGFYNMDNFGDSQSIHFAIGYPF